MKDFVSIILILSSVLAVKTKECRLKYENHDFSSLDWPAWALKLSNEESYEINLCRPLEFNSSPGKDNCSHSAICMFKNGSAESLVDFPLTNYTINKLNNIYEVKFQGPICSSNKNFTHQIKLDLICDHYLGSPQLNLKAKCYTHFVWKTSAACDSLPKTKEVPCYVYDKLGNKRDLSHLMLLNGHYLVESAYPSIEFYINICSEIKGDKNAPEGSAAYQKIGNEEIDFGNPVSGVFISNDDLKLIYNSTDDSVIPSGCSEKPRTIITFKCPRRGKSRNPRITFIANCQYDIEWETEHACPEQIVKGNFKDCAFTMMPHQIELDLSPLKKNSEYYSVKNNETTFLLNVCGGIGKITCGDQTWKSNSICMFDSTNKSEIIGTTKNAELRFVDRQITLTYYSTTICNNMETTKSSIIEFECDENADIGEPQFYYSEDCIYIFKWKTKHACIKDSMKRCYINDGNIYIDLEILSKSNDEKPWEVINTLQKEEKNSYFLYICSEVTNSNKSYCEGDSSVCKIDENGNVTSLGKFISSPIYNKRLQTVEIIYKNGGHCENRQYETHITLYCKPGVLDSPPVLKAITDEGCKFEIEWHTAAACPLTIKKGNDCKVFDNDLGFTLDLNPLKSKNYYEVKSGKYVYYLNICGPLNGTKCDQTEGETKNAAACQIDTEGERFWKLGEPNSELFYIDGMINLTYTSGTPYNNDAKTPRTTSVTFFCDHEAGIGSPEFIEEINQAYSFQWKTSYACPSNNAINCLVKDAKNEIQYDFSRLTKTIKDGNWIITQNTNQQKRKFYLNICQPLNPVEEPCSTDSFACVVNTDEEGHTTVHNLGKMISEPKFSSQGYLTLNYVSGDPCISYGVSTNYTTTIHFLCGQEKEELRFLSVLGNCEYMFLWTTEVACGVKTVKSKNKCSVVDPLSEYTLDFQSLQKKNGYNITTGSHNFQLNICGTADGCIFDNEDVSVCEVNEGKTSKILGLLKSYSLELSEDKTVTLIYEGLYNQSTGTVPRVYIKLQCSEETKQNDIKFIHQDNSAYFFELETSLACIPGSIDCSFTDSYGNGYDLTSLIKWKDRNWETSDIQLGGIHKYYINFCKPLNPSELYKCPVGEIMSCQTSDKERSFSLGNVREKPIIHSPGIITLSYKGGTPCHENQFNRSTRINLKCSTIQKDLVFVGETEECEYIFSMDTPAACPIENVVGSQCIVKTKDYGYTFDLNPLHQEIEQYRIRDGQYEYILNVCGEINNASGNCKGAAACQTKFSEANFAINTGMPNSKLFYNNGVVQLIYESGKGNCHKKFNRSTVITFTCDHSTNGAGGPKFLEEKEDCTYMFEWPTSLVCLPYTLQECSIDDGNLYYDLSPLSLPNNNYVLHTGKNSLFAINICRSVVTSNGIQCPSSSACLIDYSKSDKSREINIGKANSPNIENGKVKLHYTHGDKCKLLTGEEINFETVIEFECEEKLLISEPVFVGIENCTYYFSWSTAFACPIKNDDDSENNCVVENPITGFKYNLSSLKKNSSYEVLSSYSQHKFFINVCGAIKNSKCGPNVASCQQDTESNKKWNAGQANSRLHFHEGVLFLNYSGGDICHGKYLRNTIIEFQCSDKMGEPIFQFESEDCIYYFVWLTPLACENKIHCSVSNGSEVYDLTPLKLSRSSHVVNDLIGETGLYYLNICDSVKLYSVDCPSNAGICKIHNGSAISLGKPTSPMIDFEGYVTVLYLNGSLCDKGKTIASRIIFFCDTSIEMGEPELITIEDCNYLFQWRTNIVCPKDNLIENPVITNCTYIDNKRGIDIDLSPLRKVNSSYVVKSKRNKFLLNICGPVNTSKVDCATAGVCRQNFMENDNFGTVTNASFSYDAQTLTLNYSEGSSCIMNSSGKRSSRILFVCNPKAGIGEPRILKETHCFAVFKWETNLTCRTFQRRCSFYSGSKHYDLQLLSSLSHDWNVTDDKGNIYWLNICRETKIGKNLSCQNSAVCRKDIKGDSASLGESQSQEIYMDSDSNIILSYIHGSDSVCPKKNSYAKTSIKFICGNTLSTPKYISGPNNECVFEFLWKTRIACAEEKKEVIMENNGVIYDSRLNVNIDLSSLFNKTFSVDGVHFDESYVYIINIEKGTKNIISAEECKNAAICQTKNGMFFRDIGSIATKKFYLKGTELQLELISMGRKCGKNNNKNVTTIINFVCVEDAGIGEPRFYYESGNCDYLFEWETAFACRSNFESVIEKHFETETSASVSVQVILVLLFFGILIALIIFIVSKEDRRNAVKHKVSAIITYIRFSKCFKRNEGETLLLSSSVITTYHDDSDVEILT